MNSAMAVRIFKFTVLIASVSMLSASCGPSLAQRKEESEIHFRLGVVHLNDGNYTEALKELSAAVEKYPDDHHYQNALGLAYYAKGMAGVAEKHFKKAIALNPKFSEARVNLGAIYLDEGKWDIAISESEAALTNIFYATPEVAHNHIGWAYFNKGEHQKAVESFKKSVSLNPRYAKAYNNLGMAYEKLNNMKEAAAAFENAVKNDPLNVDFNFNLGVALMKQKDARGAVKSFEKVIEMAPGSEKAQSAREYIKFIK